MRTTRWFIAGLVCSAFFSARVEAQARYFDNSWFWGVKSGVATFSPTLGDNQHAATFGGEWLITRSRGGLYISADQANISTVSAVLDANTSDGVRPVTVSKLRRVGFAALAFPVTFGRVRPYAGLGLSVDIVGSATPLLGAKETGVDEAVQQRIDDNKSQAGLLGMAGLQVQFERLAIFGQASVIGAQSKFLLGNSAMGFFEGGIRYNIGSSRSR